MNAFDDAFHKAWKSKRMEVTLSTADSVDIIIFGLADSPRI